MDTFIFILVGYFAAGIVFITREADQHLVDPPSQSTGIHHLALQLTAGLVMTILWPVFLLNEIHVTRRLPMAIRIETIKQ